MRLLVTFTLALAVSAGAFAEPPVIDFVGLVPGVSTEADYDATLVKYSGGRKAISVGGFEIICIPDYIDGKLAELLCPLGEKAGSIVLPAFIFASNTEIHRVLVDGYIKKFGNPNSSHDEPVQTRTGVKYLRSIVIWIDSRGNQLMLISRTSNVNEGGIVLKSSAKLAIEKIEARALEQKKKF